jgi:hypothetical protein
MDDAISHKTNNNEPMNNITTYRFEQLVEAYEELWEWGLTEEGGCYLLKNEGELIFTFKDFTELTNFTMNEDDLEAYLEELHN